MGYGRINAYQALLLAHAYSNKSVSSTATASNNGRRMVKTSDNRYHLVFESGITSGGNVLSEIFYRRSNPGGTSWETPIRLSTSREQNRYPSIAERSGKLYVVWQRKTGTNTYEIFNRTFNGSNWYSSYLISTITSSSIDPLSVIAISTPSVSFEMMVVYRTSSGLKSRRSTNIDGFSWDPEITVTSVTGASNPSLIFRSDDYQRFEITWHNGSHVYFRAFNGSAWTSESNVSSGLGGSANTHEYSSFAFSTVPASSIGNRHIVWQATDPSQGNRKVIFHNLNLNPTVYTKFYSTSTNYLRPSMSGFQNGGGVVFWHDQSSAKNVRYAKHNGSSWETGSAGTVYSKSGIDASGAIANPPTSAIKAVFRSAGSSPYTLKLGAELQKSAEIETIAYSRQLIYAREDESVLALRLFAPRITGEDKFLEFPEIANDDSLATESLAEMLAFDFVVPEKAEEVKVDVEIYTKEAANLLASGASALHIGFELIDATSNTPIAATTVDDLILSEEVISTKSLSLPLADIRGKTVKLRPMLAGLDLGKVRGALVHEYGVDESRAPQGEALTSQTASSSHEFSVLAKPNPFNPSTSIQFTLPSEGVVRLRIYNLQGQLVRELLHEQRPAGAHTVTWDGKNDRGSISASGIYFLRLESSKLSKVSRLTLLR